MKVIYYCQHVLGIGHFFRSLEICKAFTGHDVILVTGGSRVAARLPSHVREIHLPELMMDQEFSRLFSPKEGTSVAGVMQERQQLLFNLFAAEAPDLFIVELYPFGRKAFRFEIDPILEGDPLGRSASQPRDLQSPGYPRGEKGSGGLRGAGDRYPQSIF